ncbi:ABC transporter substrate-binding protein [Paenibacillus sp. GCM10027626]|uniref:ABC transporter substrate-binding protein n=1 Tax=Paenibacillus sp. GCM10027626 TaxID=3273411 RepID=UPI0036311105
MKLRRQYLALWQAYLPESPGTSYEVTIEELAAIMECTPRNMVLLLRKMEEQGWLRWLPKKGRGNRSTIVLLADGTPLAMLEAQEMVAKQSLQDALQWVHALQPQLRVQDPFQHWLSGHFGLHSIVHGRQRTDILRFPLPQKIHSLDPAALHYSGEAHLVTQLFDGLVRMDAAGSAIQPHLAHGWDVDESRTEWIFYLRKGVQFHHGRELLASDVKYTLERLQQLAPHGLFNWAYANISKIEAIDDRTIRITLTERNETFLPFLTTNRASIVPQDYCEQHDQAFGEFPVGTGPFQFIRKEHGVWILDAFSAYFLGRPFLDRVEVWELPEGQQVVNTAEQPAFQIMHNVRISDMAAEQWQQIRQSGMTCKFLTVNESKQGLLAAAAMRQLLNEAINRDGLLKMLSGDVIEPCDSFWPHKSKLTAHTNCSPVHLQDKLAAAGYRGEVLLLATIPQYKADAELIGQLCARAGIQLQIQLLPAEKFKGEARMSADLLLFATMLDEHRDLRLIDLFKSMQQHMLPKMKQELELALQGVLAEPAAERRMERLMLIEEQLKKRGLLLFLYRKHLKTAFHPSIRGISLESLGWVQFRDIWFTS